ncbi:hypothetical protein ACFYTF_26925 [Nocardia thailandica]|uniref:Uncharacterized protein n=1 Tax=Nocardia thailandica TaxID=257275 RepID=A0ABW6PVM9_9NOCA
MSDIPASGLFDSVWDWAHRNAAEYRDEAAFVEATTACARHLNDREFHGRTEAQIVDLAVSIAGRAWQRRGERPLGP